MAEYERRSGYDRDSFRDEDRDHDRERYRRAGYGRDEGDYRRGYRGYGRGYGEGDYGQAYAGDYGGYRHGGFGDHGPEYRGREGHGPDYGYRGDDRPYGRGYRDEFGGMHSAPYGGGAYPYGPGYAGRGPRGYTRSDDRIREDVNDRLTDDDFVDATDVEVRVQSGEVTLNGTVDSRWGKRRAEDIADDVSGVTHVQNNLRVRQQDAAGSTATDVTVDRTAMTSTPRRRQA